jgi:hypothetical protein
MLTSAGGGPPAVSFARLAQPPASNAMAMAEDSVATVSTWPRVKGFDFAFMREFLGAW